MYENGSFFSFLKLFLKTLDFKQNMVDNLWKFQMSSVNKFGVLTH